MPYYPLHIRTRKKVRNQSRTAGTQLTVDLLKEEKRQAVVQGSRKGLSAAAEMIESKE